MKILTALILLVFLVPISVYSQTNTFPSSGNVGIGTTSPGYKLAVMGNIYGSNTLGGRGGFYNVLNISPLGDAPAYFYIDTNIPAIDEAAPQIQVSGYMYGSSNRAMKITLGWYHYSSSFYWTQYHSDLGYEKPSRVRLGKYTKNGNQYIRIELSNNSSYWTNYNISATDPFGSIDWYDGWNWYQGEMPTATTTGITEVNCWNDAVIDGKLGIGVSNPTERLSVDGNILAKKVKVTQAGWADYVFEPSYSLRPLQEVERYIQQYKHLPEVPTAKEVIEKGIDIGDNQALLLKKIEELTLYVIGLKKEIEILKNENAHIKRAAMHKNIDKSKIGRKMPDQNTIQ